MTEKKNKMPAAVLIGIMTKRTHRMMTLLVDDMNDVCEDDAVTFDTIEDHQFIALFKHDGGYECGLLTSLATWFDDGNKKLMISRRDVSEADINHVIMTAGQTSWSRRRRSSIPPPPPYSPPPFSSPESEWEDYPVEYQTPRQDRFITRRRR